MLKLESAIFSELLDGGIETLTFPASCLGDMHWFRWSSEDAIVGG